MRRCSVNQLRNFYRVIQFSRKEQSTRLVARSVLDFWHKLLATIWREKTKAPNATKSR